MGDQLFWVPQNLPIMAKMMSKKKMSSMKNRSAMKSAMKKMGKRGKNEFFTLMLAAKNKNAASFVYNGATYKRKQKGHLVFYKK